MPPLVRPVSVIICSRRRRRLLRDCVQSVLDAPVVPEELLVIDDSDAADPALVDLEHASTHVRYLWRHGRGLSSAMNDAIRKSRHDILVFTQDDALVDPTWLAVLVDALVDAGPRTIVTGRVAPGEAEVDDAFVSAAIVDEQPVVYRAPTEHDVLYALNMAMYRSAFDEIGPFDERLGPGTAFPASEDSDFAYRALQLGYAIAYEPRAVVHHRAWRGGEVYARFRFGYGLSRGGFYAKHLHLRGDRFMLRRFAHDVRDHVTPLPNLVRHDRRRAAGHAALTAGLLVGVAGWRAGAVRDRLRR
jgi:GT2 family glycosyltransferase